MIKEKNKLVRLKEKIPPKIVDIVLGRNSIFRKIKRKEITIIKILKLTLKIKNNMTQTILEKINKFKNIQKFSFVFVLVLFSFLFGTLQVLAVDTTAPTVNMTYSSSTVKAGTQTVRATYSEEIVGTPTISINQPGSTDISNVSMTTITPGSIWTARTSVAGNWISVTYGNGLFVAVANSGQVATSPDGITWTGRTALGENWNAITYGNGLFVVVGSSGTNRVLTSPDGITWTARAVPELNTWIAVTYGNGLFVAVSSTGTNKVMTSPDGITWTARTASESNTWYGVAFGNGMFVAVSQGGINRVMTSSDGITWTARAAAEANNWYGVTYGNGLFVAVAISGTNRVMTSPDGITWTPRAAAEANSWYSVTYGNGLFVAVASSGTNRVMTSPDGITWTPRVAAEANSWYSVTYGNGLFVAVASSGTNKVMTSPFTSYSYDYTVNQANGSTYIDGTATVSLSSVVDTTGNTSENPTNTTFTIDTTSPSVYLSYSKNPAGVGVNTISANYSEAITGTAPTISINQPGTTDITNASMTAPASVWTASTGAPANSWYSIAYGNGLFVAVSIDGTGTSRVMTSPDGTTWTPRNAVEASSWQGITYGNGQFVAVSNSGTNRVMTSPDGITWTARSATEANLWRNVTYGNGLFVAVASSGTNRVMTSPDGITWTPRTVNLNTWYGITYGNGLFVSTSLDGKVMTSPDGITWTARVAAEANSWYSVTYGNGLFVAVAVGGTNIIMTSPDGITWTGRSTSGLTSLVSVTYGNGLFVAVAYNGVSRVATSPDGITWTGRTASEANQWWSVAYGNGKFVAVAKDVGTGLTNRVMTSSANYYYNYTVNQANGSTYVDGTATVSLSSVTDLVGNTSASPTNTTFTIDTVGPSVDLSYSKNPAGVGTNTITATYSKGIVGTPNISIDQPGTTDIASTPMTNNSGSTWTARTATEANQWLSITYGNGLFVAVSGDGTNRVMTSPDGITWTPANISTLFWITSVTYGNELFVAVGNGSNMATSPDGINWTSRIVTGSGNLTGVTYGNGLFVAVSRTVTGVVITSPDGINWTSRNLSTTANWQTVFYGNGLFVATGTNGTNSVMTSPDGITWTPRTAPINTWKALTYGNGLFVAVSDAGFIMTSPNGITWTLRTPSETNQWYGVTYGNGLFVAVSRNGTHRVMTSLDGITWTASTESEVNSWTAITYGNGLFVAVSIDGINRVMTSSDIYSYNYTVNQANGSTYVDGAATVSLSSVVDVGGNISQSPTNNNFTIDTVAPTASITYSPNRPVKSGDSLTITANFDDSIADAPIPKIALSGVVTLSATDMTKVDATHYSYTYTVGAGNGTATVALSVGTDSAGNPVVSTPTSGATFVVDNITPTGTVTSICGTAGNACTTVGQNATPQESYMVQSIAGTASDEVDGSGLSTTQISIKDTSTNLWYNGTTFAEVSETYLLGVGTTTWSYDTSSTPLVIDHIYDVNVKVSDASLNNLIIPLSFKFTNSPPVVSNVTASQDISDPTIVNVTYDVTDIESSQTTNYLFYGVGATLNGDITSGVTSLTVSSDTYLPASGSIIVDDEIITYTSKSGNVLSGITRGAFSTTAIAHTTGASIFVKANTISGTGVGLSNKGTGKVITWNAKTDADGYESANGIIKVVVNDGSSGSMVGSLASSTFTLDEKAPTETITFDAGTAGLANSALITIPMPIDISPVYYKISDSDTETNPTTSGWVLMSGATTIPWSFDSGIEVKTLKYQWKDNKENIGTETIISTHSPVPSGSFLVQDTSNVSAVPPYYDLYIGWQATDATEFASYKLEYATSSDNTTYGSYVTITGAGFSDVNTNYYVYRNLDASLFYRFRLSIVDTNGNISVRSNSYTTAKPDGVQNYGEGGGGSVLTASKVENVVVAQNVDKTVTVTYKLTDSSIGKKVNPTYESYLFYNIGITIPNNALVGSTLAISDASKLKTTGYIQVNNEVIKYTGKTGNVLTGIVRGTWATNVSSGRTTRQNLSFFTGTPVWVMANGTTPISITDTSIITGQNGSITWNTYEESALAGGSYLNVGVKVLVHDNQDALSGPLSSQNDFSENGILNNFDLIAPTIAFSASDSSGNEIITPVTLTVNLSRAYPLDSSVTYTLTGTAVSGADYTLSNGTINILAGATTINLDIPIIDDAFKEIDNTIVVTLTNPVNSTLGANSVYTYTIINDDTDLDIASLPAIGFSTLTSQSGEDVNTVDIPVTISSTYEDTVTVDYTVTGGLAEGNSVDYLLANGTLTIPAGETTSNINIVVFDDEIAEDTENVIITLSNPTNSTLGANNIHAYSILDNEIAVTEVSSSIKATSAIISWTTGDFTNSLIEYGTIAPGVDGAYNLSKTNLDEVLEHSMYLGDLTPSTTYYYRTTSTNLAGDLTLSEGEFTTTAGAVITGVATSNITDTGVTVTWTTNIPSSSYVSYSINSDLSDGGRLGAVDLVTDHSVSLINLNSETTYYFLVDSTDGSGNISENANSGNYYTFTTSQDETGPIISDISVPIVAPDQAAIVWKTNEVADGKVKYGTTSGTYDQESDLMVLPTISHIIALIDLAESTKYYFVVESTDENGNSTESTEQTFDTSNSTVIVSGGGSSGVAQELYDILLAENESYKNKIGALNSDIPVVSNIEVTNITAFGATISFDTSEETISFIQYGKTGEYGSMTGNNQWSKNHTIKMSSLSLGSKYYFKINAMDKTNDVGSSDEQTFTTKFLSEDLAELKKIENIEQFQAEIEATIESILPSLVPPFIDTPKISDITENSAVVTFRTNIKAYPVVSYTADETYDAAKENPYDGQLSDTSAKSILHTLTLIGLKSNTKYHVMTKAFSLPQVVGSSEDFTFTTSASKIRGSIIDVKKDSFNVVWTSDQPTTSIVEYKNMKTGRISRIVDEASNSSHSVKVENLTPDTMYQVNISGINAKGNIVEGSAPLNVKTSMDNIAPTITNLKVDSALIVGRNDKAQTIVSWQTDEPATSTVYFEEGVGSGDKSLANKQEDLEFTKNHVVILTALKAGTIYRFTVNSTDDANNITKSPIRTIITPKKTESIVDIIFKNFDDTFNFINNVK